MAWRLPSLLDSAPFRWAGYAAFLLACGAMLSAGAGEFEGLGVFAFVLGSVVGALPWVGFLSQAFGTNLGFLVSWALSDNRLQVRPTYSAAEAAETRGDYEAAIAVYAKMADARPADPEPRQRMAEALLKADRPRDAAEALTQAMRIEERPGDLFLITLRLSEVLADDCGDPRAAVRVLEEHLEHHPDVAGADFARERIQRLKARGR